MARQSLTLLLIMDELKTVEVGCPYCGETIELVVDCSAGRQRYVEDCCVCCRPMNVSVTIDANGSPVVDARHEDD